MTRSQIESAIKSAQPFIFSASMSGRSGLHWIAGFLALALLAVVGRADESTTDAEMKFPEWGFCVAHVIRDADGRDARPRDPDTKNPIPEGKSVIPHGSILREGHILDVAALASRSIDQKLIEMVSAEKLLLATLQPSARHPLMDCYEPHHAFVFYSYSGKPVACIEVCLSCNRVKMLPAIRDTRSIDDFETSDLIAIARILADAGLSLTPFESLDDFETASKKLQRGEE